MLINNIVPFSNCDGPGNRLVIFVQGCNLDCIYCHNFETINVCNNCLACVEHCSTQALTIVDSKVNFNQELCVNCNQCLYTCPNSSTPKAKEYSVQELSDMIIKYSDFIDGITFSGGECTLYYKEIAQIVELIKPHSIEVLLDTNGLFNLESLLPLINEIDGLMIDIKSLNNNLELTGLNYSNLDIINHLISISKVAELRTVDLGDEESRKVINYLVNIRENNPDIRVKINTLAVKPLNSKQKEKLTSYLKSS